MILRRLQNTNPIVINISLILFVVSLSIVFIVVWGPNIKYTHTYYHLSQAVFAYAKPIALFEFYFALLLSSITFFMLFIRGSSFFTRWKTSTSLYSGLAAAVVFLLGIFLFVEIESTGGGISSLWLDPKDNLFLAGHTPPPAAATYYIYFDKQGPGRLHSGQSVSIDVVFKMLDHEVPGAYPISLDPNHSYAVGLTTTSIAFDVTTAGVGKDIPIPIQLNTPTQWKFIVSPKKDYEGQQVIIFETVIYDLDNKTEPVQDSPYATIQLTISTPFGLPNWLVSTETGIGALVGSIIAITITWVFNELSERNRKRREKEAKEKEEIPKILKPD